MAAKQYSLGAAMIGSNPAGITGKATKEKPAALVLRRIEIEIADNGGFTVNCYHEAKGQDSYVKPTKTVFGDRESLEEYLDEKLGAPDKSGEGDSAY